MAACNEAAWRQRSGGNIDSSVMKMAVANQCENISGLSERSNQPEKM